MHYTAQIAQYCRAEVYFFYRSTGAIDLGNITNPDLIFENDEKPRNNIPHEILCAKPKREAGDTSACDYWANFHTQFAQYDHARCYPEREHQALLDQSDESIDRS